MTERAPRAYVERRRSGTESIGVVNVSRARTIVSFIAADSSERKIAVSTRPRLDRAIARSRDARRRRAPEDRTHRRRAIGPVDRGAIDQAAFDLRRRGGAGGAPPRSVMTSMRGRQRKR